MQELIKLSTSHPELRKSVIISASVIVINLSNAALQFVSLMAQECHFSAQECHFSAEECHFSAQVCHFSAQVCHFSAQEWVSYKLLGLLWAMLCDIMPQELWILLTRIGKSQNIFFQFCTHFEWGHKNRKIIPHPREKGCWNVKMSPWNVKKTHEDEGYCIASAKF